MYAVIELQWHQYIVQKGSEIDVDLLDIEGGKEYVAENVLAVFDEAGKDVKLGSPLVENAKVVCEVVEHKKDPKIKVLKFKRKNRYERHIGFRARKTVLKVKDVQLNG